MARLSREELHDWLERVERRAPRALNPWQKLRAQDPDKLEAWCVDAPGEAVALLNDEESLRAQTKRLRERAASARDHADRARKSLRERFSSFPRELAQLDAVLDAGAQDPETADEVASFARDLKTLQSQQATAEGLIAQLTGEGRSEFRKSLDQAASDPRRVDQLLLCVSLAKEVVDLDRRQSRSESSLEHAPEKLNQLLVEQSDEIALQEAELARLDAQLESVQEERLRLSPKLEHGRHKLSMVRADLDRLDAEFDVLLARARTNSTFVARELYEAYRERTGREIVWRERVAAEARAKETRSALVELQRRAGALQRRLRQCEGNREQIEWERNQLQAEANHLANDNEELEARIDRLAHELDNVHADCDYHRARAVPVADLGFSHDDETALLSAGIYTLGALSDWLSSGVQQVPGLSSRAIEAFEQVLLSQGLPR